MTADYLKRVATRRVAEAKEKAEGAAEGELRKAAAGGWLGSGRLLLVINNELFDVYRTELEGFARVIFEATGDYTTAEIRSLIRDHARNLRLELLEVQRARQSRTGVHGGFPEKMGGELDEQMKAAADSISDDFAHGMIGGARLSKDPLVNIVSSISNSPGAIQQAGIGNTQTVTQQQFTELLGAIEQFCSSPDVAGLPADQREVIEDIADAVRTEAAKPRPDQSRIVRWGNRLLALAKELGVHTAAHALGAVLAHLSGV